jgi:hypothetical protein
VFEFMRLGASVHEKDIQQLLKAHIQTALLHVRISACCCCCCQRLIQHLAAAPAGFHMAATSKKTKTYSATASISVKQPADMVLPAAWLQRLVNDKQPMLQSRELSSLMAASWDMCEAVLRVMDEQRLVMDVSVRAGCHAGTLVFLQLPAPPILLELNGFND